jgi:hypothetical protein
MLNPFKLIAAYGDLNKMQGVVEKGPMTPTKITQLAALLVQVFGSFGVGAHFQASMGQWTWLIWVIAALNAVLTIGHFLLPSWIPAPLPMPTGTSVKAPLILLVICLALMGAQPVRAQDTTTTPASTSNGLVGSSDALAVFDSGIKSVGTLVAEKYDLYDFGSTKNGHVYAAGYEFMAPTPGYDAYLGGVSVKPDLDPHFKHLNVPAGALGIEFDVAAGNTILSSGGSNFSVMGGALLKYRATSALNWNVLQGQYLRHGSINSGGVSTGLAFAFGGKS